MYSYSGSFAEYDIYHGHREQRFPYSINSCGYIHMNHSPVALKRTRRDFYIIYLINGAGHYIFNGNTQTATAGHIVVYWPDHHQDYYYMETDNTELYWIHFTGSHAEELMKALNFSKTGFYKAGIHSDLITLFEKIIHELQVQKIGFHSLCTGYLIQLLSLLSRKTYFLQNPDQEMKESSQLEQVITAMNREFNQDHLISYYADLCHLSLYQFIRSFKKLTRYSPGKYIEKIRMAKAKELLRDSSLSIAEISGLTGYRDPFYFSKAFKKDSGLSPSEFRKKAGLSELF